MDYLNRTTSPFDTVLWDRIDEVAAEAARDALTGRRFLDVEGPYGAGLTSIEVGADEFCRGTGSDKTCAVISRQIPVPMLRSNCQIGMRRIVTSETQDTPLDLTPVEDAAESLAALEEDFIYQGEPNFGLEGLLTAKKRNKVKRSDWSKVQVALEDVLKAVSALDKGGFFGPYALALSPKLYNDLFNRYEGTDRLQVTNLQRLCQLGVHKAAIEGAVLVDQRVGKLVLGQDMHAGYTGLDGILYQLFLSESVVFKLEEPAAICTLERG